MTKQMTREADIYYDPYDFGIDVDPYPTFRRLRDDAPLYYNEKYDFLALSRHADVKKASVDWETYKSGHGTILELIKGGISMPPGNILAEDPPDHDLHRGLLSRVFTMRRIAELENKVRAFCQTTLDPLVDRGGFDFIEDFAFSIPMQTIGMMLGIPDSDQSQHRQEIDDRMKLEAGEAPADPVSVMVGLLSPDRFAAYIDYRRENPSDDLMTDLLNMTYVDADGQSRHLDTAVILNYVGILAAAGNETTVRLIGWAGKLLAEHPDQRRELVEDPSLIPATIEELLRYEAPSPVQARYVDRDVEHYGTKVPAGSAMLLLTASANRDERVFDDPDRFDIHRRPRQHLAFGFGIHHCLGAHLARLEARVALEELLKRFPEWDIDWDNAAQAHTSTVRGWEKLPVITSPAR
jgi:cytochrome P450